MHMQGNASKDQKEMSLNVSISFKGFCNRSEQGQGARSQSVRNRLSGTSANVFMHAVIFLMVYFVSKTCTWCN